MNYHDLRRLDENASALAEFAADAEIPSSYERIFDQETHHRNLEHGDGDPWHCEACEVAREVHYTARRKEQANKVRCLSDQALVDLVAACRGLGDHVKGFLERASLT